MRDVGFRRCHVPETDVQNGEACPVCAVYRQVSRSYSLFDWAIADDCSGKPLFPRADSSRAPKAQLVQTWSMITAQNKKSSGHSPRRSGVKRYAQQRWSVWLIQFMNQMELLPCTRVDCNEAMAVGHNLLGKEARGLLHKDATLCEQRRSSSLDQQVGARS